MMTVKKYCEENNLDPNKFFDMVLGESGSILPKARGFTGYIVEIKDDCLSCTNDKFNVFNTIAECSEPSCRVTSTRPAVALDS